VLHILLNRFYDDAVEHRQKRQAEWADPRSVCSALLAGASMELEILIDVFKGYGLHGVTSRQIRSAR
jgi:hypothetical protein